MYFSDLTNPELELYHNKAKLDGFSANLTYINNSDIFEVLSLGEGMVKVVPLFYVDEIRCNDSSVKILDNKAVIMKESNTTAYIDFVNEDTVYKTNYIDRSLLSSYTVGQDLSESEFNNLVYLMRKNIILTDSIRVKPEGLVTGSFGEYTFSITKSNIIDKGIVLTKGDNPSVVKCTLSNPHFKEYTYTLVLTMRSITDVNLDPSSRHNYVDERPIRTELVDGEEVTVDWNTLEDNPFNEVILYDARLEITCTEPLIIHNAHSLDLDITGSFIVNTSLLLTTNLTGRHGVVSGATVKFYEDETLLGTATTNSNGVATLTHTPTSNGVKTYTVESVGATMSKTVTIRTGVTPTITAIAKDILEGKQATIIIYVPPDATGETSVIINGVTYNATIINGKSKYIIDGLTRGSYTAKCQYLGDTKYAPSSIVNTTFTVM